MHMPEARAAGIRIVVGVIAAGIRIVVDTGVDVRVAIAAAIGDTALDSMVMVTAITDIAVTGTVLITGLLFSFRFLFRHASKLGHA